MAGYSAPPQAYTRDTLVKAIDWIAHQPDNMRSQATNADTLVAFYLQSKRRTSTSSSHPVSGETFSEDLKNLAKDLEQFTAPPQAPPQHYQTPVAPPPQESRPMPVRPEKVNQATITQPSQAQWNVDPKSWAAATALKERLNLSSEAEALRMMVSLGAERLSDLIP